MFDHVTIRVSDREASERFYETVLLTLGVARTYSDEYLAEWDDFSLSPAEAEKPMTRRLHIGFVAASRAHVDEFWRVGIEAGYRDDGPPGPRPEYGGDYYGGFLRDKTFANDPSGRPPIHSYSKGPRSVSERVGCRTYPKLGSKSRLLHPSPVRSPNALSPVCGWQHPNS